MTAESEKEGRRPVRDSLKFFGSFLRRPGQVGAVLPSSRGLSELLVGDLSALVPGDVVVEYGPGTGPMTRVIDARLPEGVDYIGIELEEGFHRILSARYPHRKFVLGSAADVGAILADCGHTQAQRIISGIPFASLSAEIQRGIVAGTKAGLAPDGEFRTFQYAHAYSLPSARRFRAMMDESFGRFERLGPVLLNVPPAFVLCYGHEASD